ncbi:MAG: diadenylate cyclase CdaA [Anaerolineae bacterium]|nr:diadenylate cyclase CdaA [Anaerolineae bacterium]MDW8099579.1 diadenylate cyclase CdaA [Anaerolineae bacterium]
MIDIFGILSRFNWQSALDVALVASVFYALLRLFRRTQAVSLLRGVLLVLLIVSFLSSVLTLTAFEWLVRNSLPAILVSLPVIFQPELRQALERMGRGSMLFRWKERASAAERVTRCVVSAALELSEHRHGALIVLEGDTGLQDYVETGVPVDGLISTQLLLTIFFPNSALHDGAVIVRGDRVVAAGCVLPLSSRLSVGMPYGTRHRAALGITEQSDALAVVVSEETGIISVARNGRMVRRLDEKRLSRIIETFYRPEGSGGLF